MMNTLHKQELLPPVAEGPTDPAGFFNWFTDPLPKRFLLPLTGLWIIGLDWLLFPKEAATVGLAAPFTAIVGFLAGSIGTYHFQRNYGQNPKPVALAKAALAGLLVGIPFPLAGTLVGAWVLATSGLAGLKDRLAKHVLFRQ